MNEDAKRDQPATAGTSARTRLSRIAAAKHVIKHASAKSKRSQTYSTLAVIAVALTTACVPIVALATLPRYGVVLLACEVLTLAVVRIMRPDGTWIAARGRAFDVACGIGLGMALLALSWYAQLPGPQ